MSNKVLAEAAARFLEAGERHDATRGRRKKTSTRKPRHAKPVVDNVRIELVQPLVWDVEVPEPVESFEPAAAEVAEVFGPVAEAEQAEPRDEQAETRDEQAETRDEQAETFERPAAYADPFEQASAYVAAPVYVEVEEPVEVAEPVRVDAESTQPFLAFAEPEEEAEVEPEKEAEVVPEVEALSPVCPDCDLPIEWDTDQCPHCALFLPRAA